MPDLVVYTFVFEAQDCNILVGYRDYLRNDLQLTITYLILNYTVMYTGDECIIVLQHCKAEIECVLFKIASIPTRLRMLMPLNCSMRCYVGHYTLLLQRMRCVFLFLRIVRNLPGCPANALN